MTVKEYNLCVDKYADGVYRFILKNIRDQEKARDIVQDAFARMWEKAGQIAYEKSKSYLFTSAHNRMIDVIRKEKKQSPMEESHYNHLSTNRQYSDLKEVLDEALGRLPEIQRSLILLRDYEGYSYEEIGEITELNASQVKVYIFRARNFLKQYIGSMDHVM
ncbi:MAG: RNA polymerase sigma factor [Bacteroidales bacterium]|nr:RNA polymerase sigma factor [Bacteroidales bacterium]